MTSVMQDMLWGEPELSMVLSACTWQHPGGPSSTVAWPLSVPLTGLHAYSPVSDPPSAQLLFPLFGCLRSMMSSLSFAPSLKPSLSLASADSPEATLTSLVELIEKE